MTAPDVELRTAWTRLSGHGHDELCERFLAHLREPHRRYHTATHVMWVLRHVDSLLVDDTSAVDASAIRWAALYHDAVYDPNRTDNEACSADLADRHAAELGWTSDRCDTVRRLIMATAGHRSTAPDEAILVDADLAILGADPNDYLAYRNAVRAEYGHLDDGAWRTGRTAVLRGLLAADPLFTTTVARHRWEARARANMAAELAALDGP